MYWDLKGSEPKITAYKNPKHITKLIFNDRLNTSYTVDKEPIENFDLGQHPTYKDYIKEALNPNVDENSNVYGIAKVLKPLTSRLGEMRSSIDGANSALNDLRQKVQDYENSQNENVEQPTTPVEQGGTDV